MEELAAKQTLKVVVDLTVCYEMQMEFKESESNHAFTPLEQTPKGKTLSSK